MSRLRVNTSFLSFLRRYFKKHRIKYECDTETAIMVLDQTQKFPSCRIDFKDSYRGYIKVNEIPIQPRTFYVEIKAYNNAQFVEKLFQYEHLHHIHFPEDLKRSA